jgi:uroporphyrinogen III methyltransferase/synthase
MALTLPLAGWRVLVTRAAEQSASFRTALAEQGAEVVAFPTIEIRPAEDMAPIDDAIARLEQFDWIGFTSVNGVRTFWDRLARAGRDALPGGIRVAAVGPATREALVEHGVEPHFMPDDFQGERLVYGMGVVEGTRVLLPRAVAAREELAAALRVRGALVDDIPIYRTLPAIPTAAAQADLAAGVDIAVFTSPSTIHHFALLTGRPPAVALGRALIACIGPSTAEAARAVGLHVTIEPDDHTTAGLIRALVAHVRDLGVPGMRATSQSVS